jgi:predicted nucleic acid-binding protein
MNGANRYLLDTNAVIALLAGNQGLATLLASAQWVGVSV